MTYVDYSPRIATICHPKINLNVCVCVCVLLVCSAKSNKIHATLVNTRHVSWMIFIVHYILESCFNDHNCPRNAHMT